MTKKKLSFFFLLCLFLTSCTPVGNSIEVTLTSILAQGGGKWKVAYAKFGDQEVSQTLFTRFLLEFRDGGIYVVTNPDGVLSPAQVLSGSSGKWQEIQKSLIQFDGKVTVREVSPTLSSGKVIFEWEVTVPGKVSTTYRLELIRA
jgi:hypothetical protein